MNSPSILNNSPTLSQCGSEQEQPSNTIVPPARRQRKPRAENSTRHTWSKEDNIKLMKLYYQSVPSRSGYRKRLHSLWKDAGYFSSSEQRLADQARSIRNNNLLSDIELLEIQGTVPLDLVTEVNPPRPTAETRQRTPSTQPLQRCSEAHGPPLPQQSVSQAIRTIRDSSVQDPELTKTKEEITEQLKNLLSQPSLIEVKPLRHVNRKKLKEETSLVNSCIASIHTSTITDTNTLMLAGAHIVRERLGEKPSSANPLPEKSKAPLWKRRIEDKIIQVRKDISHLEEMRKGIVLKQRIQQELYRRHPLLKKKGITCVMEELKQQLRAKAAKIKRFNKRSERYHQNKMFGNNQPPDSS